jgi:hypothetical protein
MKYLLAIYFFLKKTSVSKENVLVLHEFLKNLLVLPEFLKNQYFVKGKSPKNIEFLRNKYFFKGKSPKNV